jgi:ABC-type lipoprotein export system ATPase subunit/FtsP/CotA-like multicopper oxidase with cupredoxin domain
MISLINVSKEYRLDDTNSITPIKGINLEVQPGEFLMIVGRSGSGKTTLLNLCAGLIKPTSGQVLIDGVDIQSMNEEELSALRSRKIGFIFQFQSMLPNLTVIENVAMPAAAIGSSKEDTFSRAAGLLHMVGLGGRMDVLPKQLSAGELRRVAIARSLINHPEIILADEPTADLDEENELSVVSILKKVHETGVTIIMITHSNELVPYSTRALKVENGSLVTVRKEEYKERSTLSRIDREERQNRQTTTASSGGISRKYGSRLSNRRPPVVVYPAMWLGIIAVVLAAFTAGLALPGALRDNSSQSLASAVGAQNTQLAGISPSTYMGMGSNGMNSLANNPGLTNSPGMYGNMGSTGMYGQSGMGNMPVGTSGMGMMGMGMMGSGMQSGGFSSIIDPPPGSPFKDPVLLQDQNPAADIFEGALEAKKTPVNINGVTANLLTYNGLYPGPLIEVKKGDNLKIKFTNSLVASGEKTLLGIERDVANIHTHGMHVSPEQPADDIHLVVKPGETYNYSYDLSKQTGGVFNFIHTHIGGKASEDLWDGLVAEIIVKDEVPALSNYETHTLVLKDISLYGSDPEPYSMMDYMTGKEGNIITVNGQVNPVLLAKPGQVQRWRILNASNARFYNLTLGNQQTFYVVGTDGGGLLDKPYPMTRLLMAPGERFDILVKMGDNPSSFELLSLPYSRSGMGMMGMGNSAYGGMYNVGMFNGDNITNGWYGPGIMNNWNFFNTNNATNNNYGMMYGTNGQGYMGFNNMGCCGMGSMGMGSMGMSGMGMGGFQQVTLMTVDVKGTLVTDSIPVSVNPSAARLNIDTSSLVKHNIALSMGMMGGLYLSVDGNVSLTEPLIKSQMDSYEIWQVFNNSGMDHPFHQHVNEAQVISINGGDPDYARLFTSTPALKDTTIVPAGGSITLLVPVKDYAGTTMFHCHILEHEDMGMRGLWQIGDTSMTPMK